MQNRGKLNSDEFAVAMHLIYRKLNGNDLPSHLPPELIPPSQKALSSLSDMAKLDALHHKPIQRISPSNSLLSLSGVVPQAFLPQTPAPSASNESEEERNQVLKLVEEKRNEIVLLKEKTGIYWCLFIYIHV